MVPRVHSFVCLFACFAGAHATAIEGTLFNEHDGHWAVVLGCPNAKGVHGILKGDAYTFVATVATQAKWQG